MNWKHNQERFDCNGKKLEVRCRYDCRSKIIAYFFMPRDAEVAKPLSYPWKRKPFKSSNTYSFNFNEIEAICIRG